MARYVTSDPRSGGLPGKIGDVVQYVTAGTMTTLVKVASGNTAWASIPGTLPGAPTAISNTPTTSTDPSSGGRPGAVGEVVLYYTGGAGRYYVKHGTGNTNWVPLPDTSALGGGALSDGDYGDITVGGSGTTMTIDNGAVTLAKMANMTTDRLLGRDTAASGAPEELTVGGGIEFTGSGGIQRSALSGDVSASAGSNTTAIGANKVTNAMIRQSAGVSVIGRSANSTGDVADIAASSDGQVLRRSGGSVGFGTIPGTTVTGLNIAPWLGPGNDGAIDFDGSTSPVAGATLSSGTYTLTRNVFATTITIGNGVIINPAGYIIFAQGDITGTSSYITRDGNAGTTVAGAALAAATLPGSVAGGSPSGTSNTANANPALGVTIGTVAGGNGSTINGSSGGTGQGGGGGVTTAVASGGNAVTSSSAATSRMGIPHCMMMGRDVQGTAYTGAAGGGAASTSGGNIGGGGGSGGGWIVVVARSISGVTIQARGGNGGNGTGGNGGGGGGGAGGVVCVFLSTGSAPTIDVTGGTGGTKSGTGGNGGNGGSGVSYVMIADA